MNERLKADYQRICEMAYRARTVEEAEVPLFYTYLMCRQLGYDNSGIRLRCGAPAGGRLPLLHDAIWRGVATALWASPCQIYGFEPNEVFSFRGRLLKVEIRNVEHRPLSDKYQNFDLEEICRGIESARDFGNLRNYGSF